MNIKELEYQNTLAFDMISFLFTVLTLKMNKDESLSYISEVFELWDLRIEKIAASAIEISTQKTIEFEEIDDTPDVIKMIYEIHDTYPKALREEFKVKLRNFIDKTIISIKETQQQ